MQLFIERENLLKAVQLVSGVVEKRQTLPILANILLSTHGDRLSLTATDLEVELVAHTQLAQPASEVIQTTVSARKLLDICRALPADSEITLTVEEERVILRSGRSRFSLSMLPASEFPSLEEGPGKIEFTIKDNELQDLLSRVQFAMAQQDVRYYLNGLLLEVGSDHFRTVATDGHRLAMNTLTTTLSVSDVAQVILPRKGALELLRLINGEEKDIVLTLGSNHISVATEAFNFTSKLVDGRFPDYNRVLPKGRDKVLLTDRDEIKQLLQRVAILSNEKYRGVRFQLRDNQLKVVANNPEHEEAEDEMSVEYEQAELDIGFNVNYLLDVLSHLNPGQVKFSFSDANNSAFIEQVDNNSVYVVMPMRL